MEGERWGLELFVVSAGDPCGGGRPGWGGAHPYEDGAGWRRHADFYILEMYTHDRHQTPTVDQQTHPYKDGTHAWGRARTSCWAHPRQGHAGRVTSLL